MHIRELTEKNSKHATLTVELLDSLESVYTYPILT
jgi:hypothetical protein